MTAALERETALAQAAEMLVHQTGLHLDPGSRGRLSRCVAQGAADLDLSISDYVVRVAGDADLLQILIDRVTVQETAFFRDPGQFAVLDKSILPTTTSPLVVWCAGCSNGQEPYSVAMALEESAITNWSILATDISRPALERTRQGTYASRELSGVDAARRERHFRPVGEQWQVAPELRARVEVRQHNLVTSPPPFEPGTVQIVFCRNVLIYVGHSNVVRFLERLALWVPEGAWLFLGFSESLWQVTDSFRLVRVGDAFIYRKLSGPGNPTAAPSGPSRRLERPATTAAAPSRQARKPAPPRTVTPAALDDRRGDVGELMRSGTTAANAGNYPEAIAAFRRCVYLDPGQPLAHLHLALALEANGDPTAAQHAYRAARAALDHTESEIALGGYGLADLVRLLEAKLTPRTAEGTPA